MRVPVSMNRRRLATLARLAATQRPGRHHVGACVKATETQVALCDVAQWFPLEVNRDVGLFEKEFSASRCCGTM